MLARLGYPWYLPLNGNFAVNGTDTGVMVTNQLPALLSQHSQTPFRKCFWSAGTNDTNSGTPINSIKNNLQILFEACLDNGITPVWPGVLPRGNDASLTNAKRVNMALNEWGQWFAYTRGGLEFVNAGHAVANNATAFGNALTQFMDAGVLHPTDQGAFWLGKAYADYYSSRGIRPALSLATQQADIADGTYNQHGVLFASPNPLLQGGTTAPSGMATAGGSWSKGSWALPNGQARASAVCALAANATHYLYDDLLASGAWSSASVEIGMYVQARARVRLANVQALRNINLRCVENNGVDAVTATCLAVSAATDITPDQDLELYLLTPPIVIRPYGGSGNASLFARVDLTTGAAGSGTFEVLGFEMRRWVGDL